uniref:Uncharacterized protein n=1 Tax=Setaria viridis TaxID=4556 RepID=A0A4U6SZN5_SETVI|nr:hypothetical protein SEVIR_9G195266v2 [Setaria viridis]
MPKDPKNLETAARARTLDHPRCFDSAEHVSAIPTARNGRGSNPLQLPSDHRSENTSTVTAHASNLKKACIAAKEGIRLPFATKERLTDLTKKTSPEKTRSNHRRHQRGSLFAGEVAPTRPPLPETVDNDDEQTPDVD